MSIITKEEGIQLIKKLQDGTITIQEESKLYMEIKSRFRPHKMDNHLYTQEEIEEEFVLASWNALYRAKLNVGDPINFAIRRGNGAILDYYRRISREKLIYKCPDCGAVYSYDHRRKECANKSCIRPLISQEKYESIEITNNLTELSVELDFDIPIVFLEIIEVVKGLDSISDMEKEYAIKAIKNRVSFHDQILESGKSATFAKSFQDKISQLLSPFKDKFLLLA